MNQPLSRPTPAARADGPRGIRPASARTTNRPHGAPTFSQALTSASQQAQGGSSPATVGGQPRFVGNPVAGQPAPADIPVAYPVGTSVAGQPAQIGTSVAGQPAQIGNPVAGQAAPGPVWGGLLRPSPLGIAAPAGIDPLGLPMAPGIVDPPGLGATTSVAALAALSAAQRPIVLPGQTARMPGIGIQGVPVSGMLVPDVTVPGVAMPGVATSGVVADGLRTSQAPSKARVEDFMRSIKGFDQTKASEYDSPAQARTWGYSTCSAAALTAVLRAAGKDVKISDVMREMPNGMTVALGLVSRPSLVNAANAFGAKATDDVTSYEGLRAATESGQPVLVDVRSKKFPEGHFVVVTGVDADGVRVADSSRYDLTHIPRDEFTSIWSGKGIRVDGLVPASQPGPSRPVYQPNATQSSATQPSPTQTSPAQPAIAQPGAPTIKTA